MWPGAALLEAAACCPDPVEGGTTTGTCSRPAGRATHMLLLLLLLKLELLPLQDPATWSAGVSETKTIFLGRPFHDQLI